MDPDWQVGRTGVESGGLRAVAAGVPTIPEYSSVGPKAASGALSFSGVPAATNWVNGVPPDTITVNGVVFAFVPTAETLPVAGWTPPAGWVAPLEVVVGVDGPSSATAFAAAFNAAVAATTGGSPSHPSLQGITAAATTVAATSASAAVAPTSEVFNAATTLNEVESSTTGVPAPATPGMSAYGVVTLTATVAGSAGNMNSYSANSNVITPAYGTSPTNLLGGQRFTGGMPGNVSLDVADTVFTVGTTTLTWNLGNGLDGQEHFFLLGSAGANGKAVVSLNTTHTLTFNAAGQWARVKYINQAWMQIGGTATYA